MTLIEKALRLAMLAHTGQTRKGEDTPYIVHPAVVATTLASYGFADEVVAAALVHDVVEDTSVTANELREALGDAVADLVEMVTEDKSLPWKERKQHYIDSVRAGSLEAKAISAADKINNISGLLDMYTAKGDDIWEIFNSTKEHKLWFEEAMLAMLKDTWQHPLVDEYETLVVQMRSLS